MLCSEKENQVGVMVKNIERNMTWKLKKPLKVYKPKLSFRARTKESSDTCIIMGLFYDVFVSIL